MLYIFHSYHQDIASIEEVTQSAFMILGQGGVIQSAENHSCAECSQPYQAQSDLILNANDHSAVLGVDDVGGEVILSGDALSSSLHGSMSIILSRSLSHHIPHCPLKHQLIHGDLYLIVI